MCVVCVWFVDVLVCVYVCVCGWWSKLRFVRVSAADV